MSVESFFYSHPIFRFEQFAAYKAEQGETKKENIHQLLHYYARKGRIVSIRRGLIAVVPPNQSVEEINIDPYALAGSVISDSVLSYHTALELHGLAYSLFQKQIFKTTHKLKPFHYEEYLFQPVVHKIFSANNLSSEFTTITNRNGTQIRFTNLASTYVDVLDRPDLCGGWEEIYRSLDHIAVLPVHDVLRYCLALESPVLCAKLGYFLERRAGVFAVEESVLKQLKANKPKSPFYLTGIVKEPCQYIKKWNLMVPKSHLTRVWEEPNDAI
jgi:predicted transcriptional regulator of viral defense system